MDFAKEVKELEAYESKKWFKPTKGTYKVKILGEGEMQTKTFGEDTVYQWEIPIEINGEHLFWSITKGKTLSSLYGQIVSLAAKNMAAATGLEFDLIVKNDGKKNDYTIPQAMQN